MSYEQYAHTISQAAEVYGVPERILINLLAQESGFNPNARGGSGEIGIAQFMPGTASGLARQWGQPFDPANPNDAIPAAARHLSEMAKHFGLDTQNPEAEQNRDAWEMAVAGYNAGQGAVEQAIEKSRFGGGVVRRFLGLGGEGTVGDWKAHLPATTREKYLPNIIGDSVSIEEFRRATGTSGSTQQSRQFQVGADGLPILTFDDFLQDAGGNVAFAMEGWNAYQQAKSQGRNNEINDAMLYLEAISTELAADIANRRLSLDQANAEFNRRMDAFREGTHAVRSNIPFTIPRDAQGELFGFGQGGIGQTLGMPPPTPSYTMEDPMALASQIVSDSPSTNVGTTDLSSLARGTEMLESAIGAARNRDGQVAGVASYNPPGPSTSYPPQYSSPAGPANSTGAAAWQAQQPPGGGNSITPPFTSGNPTPQQLEEMRRAQERAQAFLRGIL